jgi:hypothetical protein
MGSKVAEFKSAKIDAVVSVPPETTTSGNIYDVMSMQAAGGLP